MSDLLHFLPARRRPDASVALVVDILDEAFADGALTADAWATARASVRVVDGVIALPTVHAAGAVVDGWTETLAIRLTTDGVTCDCGKGLWCPLMEQTVVDPEPVSRQGWLRDPDDER